MSKNQTKITEKSEKKMTDKPVKPAQKIRIPPRCRFSKIGLEFDDTISLEQFCKVSDFLILLYRVKRDNAHKFWVGDWMNYGLDNFKRRKIKTDAMGNLRQYTYGYLRNIEWVCRQIPPSRRREKLSYSHHQEVASSHLSEEEQDFWLDIAEKAKMSVKRLRKLKDWIYSQAGKYKDIEGKPYDETYYHSGDCRVLWDEILKDAEKLSEKLDTLLRYRTKLGSEKFQKALYYGDISLASGCYMRLLKGVAGHLKELKIKGLFQDAQEAADKAEKEGFYTDCTNIDLAWAGFWTLEEWAKPVLEDYIKRFGKYLDESKNHKSKQKKHKVEAIDFIDEWLNKSENEEGKKESKADKKIQKDVFNISPAS